MLGKIQRNFQYRLFDYLMYAFLSFVRKTSKEIHILGIKNPTNISDLKKFDLRSGQPCIIITRDSKIISFYIINNLGSLNQIYGDKDYLFDALYLYDLSLVNLKKYNYLQNLLINTFLELSVAESKYNKDILEDLEERIFHNFLHLKIELPELKNNVIREFNKLEIEIGIKNRLLRALRKIKVSNRKLLRKKIDLDLSGYLLKINTFIS
jgi:hypothetical protein